MQKYVKEVRARQVDLLDQHIYTILAGNLAVGLAIILVFWNQTPPNLLANWALVFFVVILIRALIANRYRAASNRSERASQWGMLFSVSAGISGVVWAFAAILFYLPDKPAYVLFIATMYAGLAAGATVSTSAYMPAFYAFIVPAMIPFAVRNLVEGGTVYFPMGITVFVYLIVSIIFARTINKTITELHRLQFENVDLMKNLERERQTAENNREIAEQAVLEKNRFLAAASHDLRQPLHASGLLLGVLRDHVKGKEGKAILDKISESSEALNHLFNSLLDVSQLDAGVVEVHPRHLRMGDLTSPLETEYRLQAKEKGLSFQVDCGETVVFADPVLLSRVLSNLLTNAITYTEHGSVSIRCGQLSDGHVNIEVSDTGVGIPDAETKQIFSEYYQINNPERDRSKGLGLGLAIVKRLCKLMHIGIELRSVPKQKTGFTLTVQSGDPEKITHDKRLPDIVNLEGVTILVIDDDKDVQEGMRKLLSTWGCETLLAESGAQAIEVIANSNRHPAIIFADYRLRENRTGVEAVHAVFEELNRQIPVVIITGDTSPDRLREVKSSGFRLLHKPVTPAELRAILQQELRA